MFAFIIITCNAIVVYLSKHICNINVDYAKGLHYAKKILRLCENKNVTRYCCFYCSYVTITFTIKFQNSNIGLYKLKKGSIENA